MSSKAGRLKNLRALEKRLLRRIARLNRSVVTEESRPSEVKTMARKRSRSTQLAQLFTVAWLVVLLIVFLLPYFSRWVFTVRIANETWRMMFYPVGIGLCVAAVVVIARAGILFLTDSSAPSLADSPWLLAMSVFLVLFPPVWFMSESLCYYHDVVTNLTLRRYNRDASGIITVGEEPIRCTDDKDAFMKDLHDGQARAEKVWLAVGALLTTILLAHFKAPTPSLARSASGSHNEDGP